MSIEVCPMCNGNSWVEVEYDANYPNPYPSTPVPFPPWTDQPYDRVVFNCKRR